MSVVAVGIAAAAVSAGTAAYSASEQSSANSKAAKAQQAAFVQQQQVLNQAANTARKDLQPYATSGTNALTELNWQLGLPTPSHGTYSMQDVPDTFRPGQTNDPVWEGLVKQFNDAHQARFGQPMNRPWESDADSRAVYQTLAQQYIDAKNKEVQPELQGTGVKGNLLQPYDATQYANDPGYTPMVNSLEDLQNTPGYQFQLGQGLQSINQSAAANGSLLSSGQLKGLNNYAQDYASTGYQAAWDRAQQAYQNAFNRNLSGKQNTYNMLSGVVSGGQAAATNQGNASVNAASALSGAAANNGVAQAQYAINQGQINSNLAAGIGNSITSGLGAYASGGSTIGKTAGNGTGIVSGSYGNSGVNNAINNYLPNYQR